MDFCGVENSLEKQLAPVDNKFSDTSIDADDRRSDWANSEKYPRSILLAALYLSKNEIIKIATETTFDGIQKSVWEERLKYGKSIDLGFKWLPKLKEITKKEWQRFRAIFRNMISKYRREEKNGDKEHKSFQTMAAMSMSMWRHSLA